MFPAQHKQRSRRGGRAPLAATTGARKGATEAPAGR